MPKSARKDGHHALEGLTQLQSLHRLYISASHEASEVKGLDLLLLSQLTQITFGQVHDRSAVISTVTSIKEVNLIGHIENSAQDAVSRAAALTCLTSVDLVNVSSLELQMWLQPCSLQALELSLMDRTALDLYPRGPQDFCEALGLLTGLTRLRLEEHE